MRSIQGGKMKSKRLFFLMAFMTVASLVLTACSPAVTPTPIPTTEVVSTDTPEAAASATPSGPVTIIIGTTDKIASLDPADAYAIRDWEVLKNVNEGLLKWKPGTAELTPALATGMPEISADGLTYTFTLRDGIKFGDGTDLTATLYAAQLNRLLTIGPGATCPNAVASALATPYVKSITAPDAKTMVFTLTSAIAYFPQILAGAPYVASDPKTFPADKCVLFPKAPVYGVGPWYIKQFTAGEQIVFEPNPYYTGDLKPQVSQIIVRDFADAQTMALAVQNGEIDIAWRILGPELVGQLQGVSGLHVGSVAGGSIRYLVINHTMKPMDDPNVVMAVASVIDRNEISDTVFGGNVSPLYSQIPPGFLGASEAFDTMYASPNMDKAKEYLAASGYTATKHVKLELWYPPEHYGASTAAWMQVIKKQLEATGVIDVDLKPQEWSTYLPALVGGKSYAAGVLGWFFDYPDPSNYVDPFVYNGGQGTNVAAKETGSLNGKPLNDDAAKLIDLLTKADSETDLVKRADLYKQAQEIYAKLVVTLPLFYEAEHVIFKDNILASGTYASPETLNIGPTLEFNYSTLTKK
jgi:peptide/nickel transport system substrate-binding protein